MKNVENFSDFLPKSIWFFWKCCYVSFVDKRDQFPAADCGMVFSSCVETVEIRSLPEISGRRYPVRKYNLIWSVPEMIKKSVNIAGFEIWEDWKVIFSILEAKKRNKKRRAWRAAVTGCLFCFIGESFSGITLPRNRNNCRADGKKLIFFGMSAWVFPLAEYII